MTSSSKSKQSYASSPIKWRDPWPQMADGNDFDGKELLTLVRNGTSPFHKEWDVNLLIQEVEENLDTQVVDIPLVHRGSNNYGFHMKLSNRPDVIARLNRGDHNMPGFDGMPIDEEISEVQFEAATYELLRAEPRILVSNLLYLRIQKLYEHPGLEIPKDISGRYLFLFQKAPGEDNVWKTLNSEQQASVLNQSARMRASLFNFNPPLQFASDWFLKRLFKWKPTSLQTTVVPTRDFCVSLVTSNIEATIRNVGDMIGWESDNNSVGPIAFAAKKSLLRLIPHILPQDDAEISLYRLVLEHGDFGIHNMTISMDASGMPLVTSLYDWETGCIAPAILSDPLMIVIVDLVTDEGSNPSYIRVSEDATSDDHAKYRTWTKQYFEVLFNEAPTYRHVIQAGKDIRHLWSALQYWRGDDPEDYFGDLGAWAERRMKELGVD